MAYFSSYSELGITLHNSEFLLKSQGHLNLGSHASVRWETVPLSFNHANSNQIRGPWDRLNVQTSKVRSQHGYRNAISAFLLFLKSSKTDESVVTSI